MSAVAETNWEDLLLAYLHDPFDKALDIPSHEGRAARYASAALGREVTGYEMRRRVATADPLAAIHERVPMPTAGPRGERAVAPNDLRLNHATSAESLVLDTPLPEPDRVASLVGEIVADLQNPRERFLALWRLLPDRVAEVFGEDAARLPADSRLPDHTLFQHADITAGLRAATTGVGGLAYLSFALGPVQTFIEAARSVRDLWTGSATLSWLAFQAMRPILDRYGPTAFVYPALRGAPLVDIWLRNAVGLEDIVPLPREATRRAPSLPHRFVAVVPWGRDGSSATGLRGACLDSVNTAWRELAEAVRELLSPDLGALDAEWDRAWDRQIDNALEFHVTVAPERHLDEERLARLLGAQDFGDPHHGWPDAAAIRRLGEALPEAHRPRYAQNQVGRWQAQLELSARLMAAERAVRPVPAGTGSQERPSPGKCSLLGSWEQMGPSDFDASRKFWKAAQAHVSRHGVRLRPRERFCSVALTKRFAAPALLARELDLGAADLRFPDTATVAANDWLRGARINPDDERARGDWNGQWLHWRRRDEGGDDEGPVPTSLWKRIEAARNQDHLGWPPTYYAVIAMDGDRLGEWLGGRRTPTLRDLLHPKLTRYFEALDNRGADRALDARRHVGPALHGWISSALAAFATEFAPEIVAAHNGVVIYSGGDDLLALCPVVNALSCSHALRRAFSGEDYESSAGWRRSSASPKALRPTMGPKASMSAGLAIVHFRSDLRFALDEARRAEKAAKDSGRDRLQLIASRRSGERAAAVCPWSFIPDLDELRAHFAGGASNRWTYKLRAELPTLASDELPFAAMAAEIHRLVDHGDGGPREEGAGVKMANRFERYCRLVNESDRASGRPLGNGILLEHFVTLCQSAAFMARGRDD
jgi:CRISPR-associated protein Cmr2